MIDKHFTERLSLRDKFSALAREVLALDKKKPYHYFDMKREMRNTHGIEVVSPMTKQRVAMGIKARKTQRDRRKRPNKVWSKLNLSKITPHT